MNKKVTVAYQGVSGAYTHSAAAKLFSGAEYIGVPTFEDVVKTVNDDVADYALYPIENSTAGRVANIHILVPESGLFIRQEYFLPIHHQLIARKGTKLEDVKNAYSLHQALAQSEKFLHEHGIQEVQFGDTAAAVHYISQSGGPNDAAIGSREAAAMHDNVEIIAENIQTNENNVTRFVVLGKEPVENLTTEESALITSIFYKTKNIPAALYKSLSGFATAAINIIKLESFVPMLSNNGASFYLEFEGSANTDAAKQALLELSHYSDDIKMLGSYKKDEFRTTHS